MGYSSATGDTDGPNYPHSSSPRNTNSSSYSTSPTSTSSYATSPPTPKPHPNYDSDSLVNKTHSSVPTFLQRITKEFINPKSWHLELPQKIATYRLHLKYAENPLHEYDLLKACFEHPAIKPFSLKDIRIHIASLTDLHHSMRKPITWNVEMLSSDAPIILCRMRLAVVKVFVTRKSSPFSSTYPSSSQDAEGINVAAEEEKKPTKIQVTSKDVRRWIEATIETACSEYENMTGMNDTDDVAGADSLRANYKKNGLVKDMCGASVCKSEEDGELYQFWWHVDRDVQGIVMGDRVRTQLLHGGYLAGSD